MLNKLILNIRLLSLLDLRYLVQSQTYGLKCKCLSILFSNYFFNFRPSQYQSLNQLNKLSNNNTMGTGSRFSYKITKNDETTPGPGMY
jgi:hypothetical protein